MPLQNGGRTAARCRDAIGGYRTGPQAARKNAWSGQIRKAMGLPWGVETPKCIL